jgi:hypothetical protein
MGRSRVDPEQDQPPRVDPPARGFVGLKQRTTSGNRRVAVIPLLWPVDCLHRALNDACRFPYASRRRHRRRVMPVLQSLLRLQHLWVGTRMPRCSSTAPIGWASALGMPARRGHPGEKPARPASLVIRTRVGTLN